MQELCECGCGNVTAIAKHSWKKIGQVKGKYMRFIHGHNGRVRPKPEPKPFNDPELVKRFWQNVIKHPDDGCWERTSRLSPLGYGRIKHNGEEIMAHRCSWMMMNGPIPKGMCVCHRCDNPKCVRPDHLFLGTQIDNIRDMHSKNRQRGPRGEKAALAVLTAELVTQIRTEYTAGGCTYRGLAAKYKVSGGTVNHLINRRTWKHIP